MIKLIINVRTRPHKLTEFLQTLDDLIPAFKKEEGNLSYQYDQDSKDINDCHIRAEWQSWQDLENHHQGNLFAVLMGAIRILCEKPDIKIVEGSKVKELE